jgi:hypothetical protein
LYAHGPWRTIVWQFGAAWVTTASSHIDVIVLDSKSRFRDEALEEEQSNIYLTLSIQRRSVVTRRVSDVPAIHYEGEKVHLTDVAMESAGVTLVKGDLRGIACTSLSN